MRKARKIQRYLVCLMISFFIFNTFGQKEIQSKVSTCPIILKTNGGGIYPDYGLYIAEQLDELGIEVEVKVEEWTIFVGTLCLKHDYDLGIRTFDFSLLNPDPTNYFNLIDNTELLGMDIPYVPEALDILKQAQSITDQSERIETYIEWSNLVLDKIAHIFPLFNQRRNHFLWSNTLGYDIMWGLANSLPQIFYDGYHNGQVSLEELNLALSYWIDLNPLSYKDPSSELLIDLIFEPILQVNPYTHLPTTTGLINSWTMINDTYYTFHLRDDIFWCPSFNITERTPNSLPLNSSDLSTLMVGLKSEFSNGTNQRLTAKDVVFSLLAYSNPLISDKSNEYSWMKSLVFDPVDEFTFSLIVDGNSNTPENELYAPLWSKLNVPCLPEFFLNSTSTNITQSASEINMVGIYENIDRTAEWKTFRKSAFGCGKYLLDYAVWGSKTLLQKNPNWYNISPIDGTIQYLNIPKINVFDMNEDAERRAEFKAGKLDFYNPEVPFSDTPDINFIYQTAVSDEASCLFFNLRRPFIGGTDNFVNSTYEGKEEYTKASTKRKAICYAIDRDLINEELNFRWYNPQHGLINEIFTHPYLDEIFDYEYDLDSSIEWFTGIRPTTTTPSLTNTISYSFGFIFNTLMFSIIIHLKIHRKHDRN